MDEIEKVKYKEPQIDPEFEELKRELISRFILMAIIVMIGLIIFMVIK